MSTAKNITVASIIVLGIAYIITIFFPKTKTAVAAAIIASPIPPVP